MCHKRKKSALQALSTVISQPTCKTPCQFSRCLESNPINNEITRTGTYRNLKNVYKRMCHINLTFKQCSLTAIC